MKKLLLMVLLSVSAFYSHANSLTVINKTGCKYWGATDGGIFSVPAYATVFFANPSAVGPNYFDMDFHNVKIAVDPTIDVVSVAEDDPSTKISLYNYACHGNAPFQVTWDWVGGDVEVTID